MATVTPIKYTGLIFCPTVSTGAFVARRNGKVFVTGNSGFPKSLDVSKALDDKLGGVRGTVKVNPRAETSGTMAGSSDTRPWIEKSRELGYHEVADKNPITDAARQWQGWGTALKPALEPITVARKPLVGTVAENVLAHGTGALNIDGCRVGDEVRYNAPAGNAKNPNTATGPAQVGGFGMKADSEGTTVAGRWPANLIHDGSEEVIKLFPSDGNDSAARFFYSPKVGKEEREFGMEGFDKSTKGVLNMRSDSHAERNGNTTLPRSNVHPTVKPVDLMRYLCRLVTPPGGIVLDPFAGSGTTGIAATIEKFRAILIEREDQYAEICRARVGAAKPMGNGDLWETVASVNGKGR